MIRVSSLSMTGRRDKRYYALTSKGLKAFINENYFSSQKPSTEEFWKTIIWYCIRKSEEVNFSEIEEYCSYFESIYIGHRAINSYVFQSQFFVKLIEAWSQFKSIFNAVI